MQDRMELFENSNQFTYYKIPLDNFDFLEIK